MLLQCHEHCHTNISGISEWLIPSKKHWLVAALPRIIGLPCQAFNMSIIESIMRCLAKGNSPSWLQLSSWEQLCASMPYCPMWLKVMNKIPLSRLADLL
mmetsp:Transcript_86626/g.171977  ORF Transcript_86626/g.171977 Transcript_86626/m.171977 type:complete len:99 (-) Transcript_86626:71-367(-)